MSNLSDVIKGANIFTLSPNFYTFDRFGYPVSAIFFNYNHSAIPYHDYFDHDFSVIVWIYLYNYFPWTGIITFSNVNFSEYLILGFNKNGASLMITYYEKETNTTSYLNPYNVIELKKWHQISFVLEGTTALIYVNGTLIAINKNFTFKSFNKTNNYIGRNIQYNKSSYAIYDDLKIFPQSLSSSFIINDFIFNSPGKFS